MPDAILLLLLLDIHFPLLDYFIQLSPCVRMDLLSANTMKRNVECVQVRADGWKVDVEVNPGCINSYLYSKELERKSRDRAIWLFQFRGNSSNLLLTAFPIASLLLHTRRIEWRGRTAS
jgi:hypothetical protein